MASKGPFQLKLFCDSMILKTRWLEVYKRLDFGLTDLVSTFHFTIMITGQLNLWIQTESSRNKVH